MDDEATFPINVKNVKMDDMKKEPPVIPQTNKEAKFFAGLDDVLKNEHFKLKHYSNPPYYFPAPPRDGY